MNIIMYKPEHLLAVDVQDAQRSATDLITPEYAESLLNGDPTFTFEDQGEIIGCGGCVETWPGRHILWSVLSRRAGPYMIAIVRATKRLIATKSGRIEAVVRSDFEQGHRLARMCGLAFHHHEERFLPDGGDADIYVRLL